MLLGSNLAEPVVGLADLNASKRRHPLPGDKAVVDVVMIGPTDRVGAKPGWLLARIAVFELVELVVRTHQPVGLEQRDQLEHVPIRIVAMKDRIVVEVAGDFNNNPIFHRNDPNWDMLELIALLKANGLVSAYHEFNELEHGDPREQPTRFRPDPIGGTDHHHVDYCFIPREWMPSLRRVQIGQPDNWFREVRAEEHVPVAFDFDSTELSEIVARQREKSAS